MKEKIVVIDYSRERLDHLKAGLRARFSDIEVSDLQTQPPDDRKDPDFSKLIDFKANVYDILICRIGGNPSGYDCPTEFNVRLFANGNVEDSIHRSKAVGEPPLLLPFSVFFAIRDAVASVADYRVNPPLHAPATGEAIPDAVDMLRPGLPVTSGRHHAGRSAQALPRGRA